MICIDKYTLPNEENALRWTNYRDIAYYEFIKRDALQYDYKGHCMDKQKFMHAGCLLISMQKNSTYHERTLYGHDAAKVDVHKIYLGILFSNQNKTNYLTFYNDGMLNRCVINKENQIEVKVTRLSLPMFHFTVNPMEIDHEDQEGQQV